MIWRHKLDDPVSCGVSGGESLGGYNCGDHRLRYHESLPLDDFRRVGLDSDVKVDDVGSALYRERGAASNERKCRSGESEEGRSKPHGSRAPRVRSRE